MTKKRINATLYLESKWVWKDDNYVREHNDGFLFSGGRYPTKILPADLPEWYVYGYMYKRHGYISAKGVKHIVYKPNYVVDNHLFKYDYLFISYDKEIVMREGDIFTYYENYEHLVYGSLIEEFVQAAGKYSDYEIADIQKEIKRKKRWYYKRNPL